MSRPRLHKGTGFTLIELLVVIAIIGMLLAVVLTSLAVARQKSRDAKRLADLRETVQALELYFDRAPSYPSTVDTTNYPLPGSDLVTNGFMPQVPVDPVNSSIYTYKYVARQTDGSTCVATTGCASFVVWVPLERPDNDALKGDFDGVLSGVVDAGSPNCVSGVGADQCYAVIP